MAKDKHWKEEESADEYFLKGFKDNFAFWIVVGGLHPGKTGPRWIGETNLFASTILVIFLSTTLIKVFPDIIAVTESANLVFFFSILMVMIGSFIIQRGKVQFVYRTIGKGFHDYEDTLDAETQNLIQKALDGSKKQKHFLVTAFTTLIIITYCVIVFLRPIMKYKRKDYLLGEPDDGLLRVMPAVIWVPGDKNNFWVNLSMFLFEFVMGSFACGTSIAHHLFFLSVGEACSTQCFIIGLTMKHARRRAAAMNGPFVPSLRLCMAHSIRHYSTVSRVVSDAEAVVSIAAFVFIGGAAFMICLSGFLFISDVPAVVKIGGALFLLSVVLGTFVYCYYGEQVKTMSENIHDELYSGDWIENMVVLKNYMLILQSKTRNGIQIRAGGFLPLNLNTYSNMLSSAFSYFNLLNAVN